MPRTRTRTRKSFKPLKPTRVLTTPFVGIKRIANNFVVDASVCKDHHHPEKASDRQEAEATADEVDEKGSPKGSPKSVGGKKVHHAE